ncbi:MAG: DUF1501 domain-containing protein [Rhodocyclales bacterium GT-UBC]|nr:MAG: DUF1501 domain-containing protein [Rhodocyclales bacterium GT-UBC]
MKRRDFLKMAGGIALAPGVSGWVSAAQPAGKPVFVMVFLRGGADGLHLVGPAADPHYIAARPAELRVLDSGDKAGPLLDNALQPELGFRLHPALAPLLPLYQSGQLAIAHAIGLTNATRSHFVAQDMMERGVASEKGLAESSGWLARALPEAGAAINAYSTSNNPVFGLKGAPGYLAAPDLTGGIGFPYGEPTRQLLAQWSSAGTPFGEATRQALTVIEQAGRAIARDGNGKVLPYLPAGNANYGAGGDFGKKLAAVAQMVRADIGLQAAWVDFGIWDTHENQGGRVADLAARLAGGLAAFHEDMSQARRPVVLVALSEFGRRLRANKSNGTDHGHGGVAFMLGSGVRGGRMLGRWPGLATPQLDEGVDLAVTTDYRALLAGALNLAGMRSQFPGWSGSPLLLG